MDMDGYRFKTLNELTLMDDYMFGAVMQEPDIAKVLLQMILGMEIRRVIYAEPQRTVKERYHAKGIRMDLYVEDEHGTIFNVEVQTTSRRHLPRRMRYYQSVIDLHILHPGADYQSLRQCYVIFICNYDPFGMGRCVYTFENRCLEAPELGFGDGTVKVVVNTKGAQDDASDALKETLRYLDAGVVTGPASRTLEDAVNRVKNSEDRRREYMLTFARDMELREEAIREGMEKGMQQGMQQGMQRGIQQGMQQGVRKGREEGADIFGKLATRLISMNRLSDIERAAADHEYRAKLFREFGLA